MTDEQTAVLSILSQLNKTDFGGWFRLASPMAIVTIESSFRQFARRFEPSLPDASYGYMQLLSQTAQDMGYTGPCYPNMPDPTDLRNNPALCVGTLYDPFINLFFGLRYLRAGWDQLSTTFGRPPRLSEWLGGYNQGYNAAARGRPNPAYSTIAIAAFQHWSATLGEDNSDLAE